MAISLNDLITARKKLNVTFAGHKVGFEYVPGTWTAAQERDYRMKLVRTARAVGEGGETGEAAITESMQHKYEYLAAHLYSWEVNGPDGKPLPINVETLAEFPAAFTNALYFAIEDDRNPNPKTGGKSGGN